MISKKGETARIGERDTKSGKEFWILSKNGTNYGTRDKSLADYLKQGNTIEFCWIENRGHRVVTTLRKVPSKDDQILKMSYLSPPYRLVSRIGINPKKSKRLTLEVAKEFEEYVKRG